MDDVDLSASFSKEAPEGVGKLHLDGLSNGQVRFCRCRFPLPAIQGKDTGRRGAVGL
jgi:hypothetical protein